MHKQTPAEKSAKAEKKRKEKEAKEAKEQKKAKRPWRHFFQTRDAQREEAKEEAKENLQEEATANQNDNESNARAAGAPVAAEEDESFHTAPEPEGVTRMDTEDGWENLDSDDEDDDFERDDDPGEDPFDNFERDHSTMGRYLEAVYKRLQKETTQSTAAVDRWLMRLITADGWWLRRHHAPSICKDLEIVFDGEESYYRDIYVWLPDVRWGDEALPFCPTCETQQHVRFHAYRDNHFGRVVLTCKDHYFTISRRYICGRCKKVRDEQKQRAMDSAAHLGVTVEEVEEVDGATKQKRQQFTFMGYNPVSVQLLPNGYGNHFPAFLTFKGAVDMGIIDLMRPLSTFGV